MQLSKIQPVILTCANRPIEPLLASLENSGLRHPCIFNDEYQESRDGTLGAAKATKAAIALAVKVADLRDCNTVLFLEDDVSIHELSAYYIRATVFPSEVGVISLCDMREMRSRTRGGVYTRSALGCDNRGWWGNQALLMRIEVARLLAGADWFSERIESFPGVRAHAANFGDGGKNCSDIRLSLIVHDFGGPYNQYAVHVPSLFRHDGVRSLCFPDREPELGERETRNWIGDRVESYNRPTEPIPSRPPLEDRG